ncbi:response regulator transcription factor [Streptomyces anulatus]|nr:response regulator transcription factor [Streptomyces anulatus]
MEETTPGSRPVRVLIADDEALIRAGVRAILARDPHVEVVAEAGDGHEAIALTRAHRPDVVLLDIQMPGLDGLAAAARLHRESAAVGVIMLTTFGQDAHVSAVLAKLGARNRVEAAISAYEAGLVTPAGGGDDDRVVVESRGRAPRLR